MPQPDQATIREVLSAADDLASVMGMSERDVIRRIMEHNQIRDSEDAEVRERFNAFLKTASATVHPYTVFDDAELDPEPQTLASTYNAVSAKRATLAVDVIRRQATNIERGDVVDSLVRTRSPDGLEKGPAAWLSEVIYGLATSNAWFPCHEVRVHDLANGPPAPEDGWRIAPNLPVEARFAFHATSKQDARDQAMKRGVKLMLHRGEVSAIYPNGSERTVEIGTGEHCRAFVQQFCQLHPETRRKALSSCAAIQDDADRSAILRRGDGELKVNHDGIHDSHPTVIDLAMTVLDAVGDRKPTRGAWQVVDSLRHGELDRNKPAVAIDEIRRQEIKRLGIELDTARSGPDRDGVGR